jgi:hypothetical protein
MAIWFGSVGQAKYDIITPSIYGFPFKRIQVTRQRIADMNIWCLTYSDGSRFTIDGRVQGTDG